MNRVAFLPAAVAGDVSNVGRRVQRRQLCKLLALILICLAISPLASVRAAAQQPEASPVRQLGTVKRISGNSLTLATDAGAEINVQVTSTTRVLRTAPGQKDLKDAKVIPVEGLQEGDRVLVRGAVAQDGKSLAATSIIAMKKTDIAQRQQRDIQEWQRRGIGGLVKAVDPSAGTVTISTLTSAGTKEMKVNVAKNTIVRRYAPNSVKFDDAKKSTLAEIKPGDQLRARGTAMPENGGFAADEVVSGSFLNLAGVISATNAGDQTLTLTDLSTKKPVTVQITSDSQLKKLPTMLAQRIAARLKGATQDNTAQESVPSGSGAAQGSRGRMGQHQGGDIQQMLSRLPSAGLSDLQNGEAVLIVATEGGGNAHPTAITLLGGVEPILTASPKGSESLLSPWTLSSAPSDTGVAQ